MDARDDILRRVRERLGRDTGHDEDLRAQIRASLAKPDDHLRPRFTGDLVTRFSAMAQVSSSTVERVAGFSAVPQAVRRYLDVQALAPSAVCGAEVAQLAWADAGLAVEARGARDGDLVGITGCFCAIAETGTLMVESSAESPPTVSLLPETHIALVPVGRIVPDMEEAWQLYRKERGQLPRAVNFISGPSRTGDIEQTIVIGAHGPYRVHLVVID